MDGGEWYISIWFKLIMLGEKIIMEGLLWKNLKMMFGLTWKTERWTN
ncbi:hypothetical protein JOE23_002270 [Amphibacillus cookii]|nr:hypothetical protein [Amphibacillus cookii]